jgi:hypothetical protein
VLDGRRDAIVAPKGHLCCSRVMEFPWIVGGKGLVPFLFLFPVPDFHAGCR